MWPQSPLLVLGGSMLEEERAGRHWGTEVLYMNMVAAGIAYVSDVAAQVVIEGKELGLCRKRDKVEDDPHRYYSFTRSIKFMGLNIILAVPTAMWVGKLEEIFPNRPFFQTCFSALTWNPMMFVIALSYRAVFFMEPMEGEVTCQRVERVLSTDYQYFPYTLLYVFPVFLVSFYLIPVKFMPVFVATVDFFSDIFGSWFMARQIRAQELDDMGEGLQDDEQALSIVSGIVANPSPRHRATDWPPTPSGWRSSPRFRSRPTNFSLGAEEERPASGTLARSPKSPLPPD
eukprot:GGOE01019174.1.p1 GENE.GGOE01019174.1~~GGOE01019174.1.p1  ORF type:complete len:287 (-),score=56.77 GGOE01019174.1:311-1171(-)